MSSTMHFSWTHALAVHAPTAPRWFTSAERAVSQAVRWLTAERPAGHVYETHAGYIEDALMAREMYRL
ncbi:hypothetical protein BOO86_28305 [Mycobacterium sp. CBMA 234]|uniref:hypothetical protein n=1 Tax=Mycolicibacterium sp. CBMA 234 TaxID=1918495 RepID=UPI0012DCDFB6|nr:hypothetical protein [Mycolicibacterium sp. CBMA 234]MUL68402.1 hypothetical protein [Mycolicibacterium sp. CBMA 234]